MPLSIEDPNVERLARDLAARQGRSVTEVVTQALEDAWQRETHQKTDETATLVADLLRIAESYRQLPTHDDRSDDEILGYDEQGLPR